MQKAKNIKELEMFCMEEFSKSSQVSSSLLDVIGRGSVLLVSPADASTQISLSIILNPVLCEKMHKNMQHNDTPGTGSAIQVIVWHVISHGFP